MRKNHADFKGGNNPNHGKHYSEEVKQKMRRPKSEEHKQKMKGRYISPLTMKKIKLNRPDLSGENNPNWIDGRSFFPYCPKFNKELKESVRDRDNRTCQLCNAKEDGKLLSVHHIHYDKENCYPDLIALCGKCNLKANINREYYEWLFMNKLNDRNLLFWTMRREGIIDYNGTLTNSSIKPCVISKLSGNFMIS